MWETSWKGGKKHSDPFIYNHSGVDLALFSVPARELKWSSNSYYKAINLWVLTYASPLAICFLYRGLTVKLAVLIKWVCIRCYCPLLLDVSTAARGKPIHTAPTPGQFPDPRGCWHSGHLRRVEQQSPPSHCCGKRHGPSSVSCTHSEPQVNTSLSPFLDPALDFKRMLWKSGGCLLSRADCDIS